MSILEDIDDNFDNFNKFKKKKPRTKLKKEQDYTKITELYLENKPQSLIAKVVGLSQTQVCKDISNITKRWAEENVDKVDQIKAAQLKKLDVIESEMWVCWHKSKRIRQTTIKRGGIRANQNTGNGQFEVFEEEELGDTKYMDRILDCIDKRVKIIGGYAPTKIAQTDITGTKEANAGAREEILAMLEAMSSKTQLPKPENPQNLLEARKEDYIDAEEVTEVQEIEENKSTFMLLGETKGFLCLICNQVTWKQNDFVRRYCPTCNLEHVDKQEEERQLQPSDLPQLGMHVHTVDEKTVVIPQGTAQEEPKLKGHDVNIAGIMDDLGKMSRNKQ